MADVAGPGGEVAEASGGRRLPLTGWLRRFSFRTRLSTLTALAVGIAIALAAIASYVVVSHQLRAGLDKNLQSNNQNVVNRLHQDRAGNIDLTGANASALSANDILQVVTSDGRVFYPQSLVLPVTPKARSWAVSTTQGTSYDGTSDTSTIETTTYRGTRYRILSYPLGVTVDPSTGASLGLAVELAKPTNTVTHPLSVLRLVLLVVALCGVALAVGLGLLVARTTIRPVVRLTRAAEHVASTRDLDAGIEEDGNDELARLAHAFNNMLGALGDSRRQQAQLVSDAGHELRTPLTSLRTNVEVLMRVEDLPVRDREELLGDIRAQVEELTTLIGDVVELAREDERQPEATEVRLDDVVRRAIERAERRAPGLQWSVSLTAGSVRAQPALLERAVLNVLDNATKWSPPGGTIEVSLARLDRWQLDVRDQGPGIAIDDLPKVFDRFYRAPTARAMPGSGLGLAIVRQVVTAHGGTVVIGVPPEGGTHVHIELPIVAESEPGDQAWDEGSGPSRPEDGHPGERPADGGGPADGAGGAGQA